MNNEHIVIICDSEDNFRRYIENCYDNYYLERENGIAFSEFKRRYIHINSYDQVRGLQITKYISIYPQPKDHSRIVEICEHQQGKTT